MDKLDNQIFKEASKHLNKDKAKEICKEAIKRDLENKDELDIPFATKHGEAVIFLDGINELDNVRQEIYESDWYKSYFDKEGNLIGI